MRVEADILQTTCSQEDMIFRLGNAGQINTIDLDHIKMKKLESELDFRLNVIDRVKENITSELIA